MDLFVGRRGTCIKNQQDYSCHDDIYETNLFCVKIEHKLNLGFIKIAFVPQQVQSKWNVEAFLWLLVNLMDSLSDSFFSLLPS